MDGLSLNDITTTWDELAQGIDNHEDYEALRTEWQLQISPAVLRGEITASEVINCVTTLEKLNRLTSGQVPALTSVMKKTGALFNNEEPETETETGYFFTYVFKCASKLLAQFNKAMNHAMALTPIPTKHAWVLDGVFNGKEHNTLEKVHDKLKTLKLPRLTPYAPLILKYTTKVSPPLLSSETRERASKVYVSLIENNARMRQPTTVLTWITLCYTLQGEDRRLLEYFKLPKSKRLINILTEYKSGLRKLKQAEDGEELSGFKNLSDSLKQGWDIWLIDD